MSVLLCCGPGYILVCVSRMDDSDQRVDVATELIALQDLVEEQRKRYESLLETNQINADAGETGKLVHSKMSSMTWDAMQQGGQTDISITEVRESKLEEMFTKEFKSVLKSKNRDTETRKQRHKENKLFNPDLNTHVIDRLFAVI